MTEDPTIYRGDPPAQGYQQPNNPPAAYPPPGYAPQGYAPPGYAPQGYGPPGYAPQGYPQLVRPTNTMAILALVFIFVFAPASVVLGVVARKQIRQTGEQGDGMALAGIIVGGIATGLFVLLIVFWIVAFASLATGSFGP